MFDPSREYTVYRCGNEPAQVRQDNVVWFEAQGPDALADALDWAYAQPLPGEPGELRFWHGLVLAVPFGAGFLAGGAALVWWLV